jgi:hypothetical protein
MGANDNSNGKYTTPFSEKLLVDALKKAGKRLDMGKCCLHLEQFSGVSASVNTQSLDRRQQVSRRHF